MALTKWFATGCILMGIAVILGAFGAHGLKDKLDAYSMAVYEKAAFYHFIHALALLLVTLAARLEIVPLNSSSKSLLCFTIGILLFSGSLYLLAITGIKWLGAITPIGGTLFIVGWAILALGAFNKD